MHPAPAGPARLATRLRRRFEVVASTPALAVVALLGLLALPGLAVLLRLGLAGGPLAPLALLVPGALLVGAERMSRPTPGPAIHDRQLDGIVATVTGVGAVALGLTAPDLAAPLLVLAAGLLAVGVVALLHGTRRLWQCRAAPLLLLAAWPTPWDALARAVSAVAGPPAAAPAVAVGVLLVVGALLVAPRLRRDRRALPRDAVVPTLAGPAAPQPRSGGPAVVTLTVRERARVAS